MKKNYFKLTLSLALGLASLNGSAQFSGPFDPSNWTLTNVDVNSDANVNTAGAPASITFNGNDSGAGGCCSLYDDYSVTIPCGDAGSGTLSFNYNFTNPDIESFSYVVNGVATFVTSSTTSGTVSIPVSAGNTFGFRITTQDDCCGMGVLVVTNFAYTDADLTGPVADVVSLTDATGDCSVTPVAPTATDNCSGALTGTTATVFPVTALGTTIVTWTYTDAAGNTATQDQNVVVTDAIAPVADVVSLADATGDCAVTPVAPTATDNCAGAITGTPSETFPIGVIGTTVVTWTYDDGNGNVSTQDQNVVVTDAIAPVADVVSLADATGDCSVTPVAPTATDNCAGAITGTPSETFPITAAGTTVVTWTYDDGNGNVTTQDQNVIVANPLNLVASTTDEITGNDGSIDLTITGNSGAVTIDWDNDGTGDNDDTEDLTGLAGGTYTVVVTDGAGCTSTLPVIVNSQVGISENNSQFTVYPNPTSSVVFINLNTAQVETIQVTNSLGQVIANYTVSGSTLTLDMTAFENGIYYINFMNQQEIVGTEMISKL